jgi:hypothetical protein
MLVLLAARDAPIAGGFAAMFEAQSRQNCSRGALSGLAANQPALSHDKKSRLRANKAAALQS